MASKFKNQIYDKNDFIHMFIYTWNGFKISFLDGVVSVIPTKFVVHAKL